MSFSLRAIPCQPRTTKAALFLHIFEDFILEQTRLCILKRCYGRVNRQGIKILRLTFERIDSFAEQQNIIHELTFRD